VTDDDRPEPAASPADDPAGDDPPRDDPSAALDRDVPSFRAAIDELEAILRRIESEEVDIDRLAAEVARATELVEVCRGKLRRAEVQVTQIVHKLDEGDED
jgi:exodeoxyribonuclease VII small subunit